MPAWTRKFGTTLGILLAAVGITYAVSLLPLWDSTPGRIKVEGGQMSRAVSRAEADQLLNRTVTLAKAGQYRQLCTTVTDSHTICRNLIDSAKAIGRTPGATAPKVVSTTRTNGSLILHLQAVDAAGESYTADFSVTRGTDSRPVANYPIYWSGVKVHPNSRE